MTKLGPLFSTIALCLLGLTGEAMAASDSSRLYAPKRGNESDQRFFVRASREIGSKASSPEGRAALDRLARGAGYNAIRSVVERGGVRGSASGNSYVTYYRTGWNQANLTARTPSTSTNTTDRAKAPAPPGRRNTRLEQSVRAMMAQTKDGQAYLSKLDATGVQVRFQKGGGTYNDATTRSLVVDRKLGDGHKPLSWLSVSVRHEASHAWDDHTGQTPKTVSPLGAQLSQLKAAGKPIPRTLVTALARERDQYVTRQVAGEARGMSGEVRLRRQLEAKGVDFHGLDRTLIDAYNKAHDRVYRAAGVTPPKD